MSGGRKKLPPLPMPELITVGEKVRRLKAAGEWPPCAVGLDAAEARAAQAAGPCGTLLFAASMGMLDPPWLERTARTEAEAEAAAKKRQKGQGRLSGERQRREDEEYAKALLDKCGP